MKTKRTIILLAVALLITTMFMCIACQPISELSNYKKEKTTKLQEYADSKLMKNVYTTEGEQEIEKYVSEGKRNINNAKSQNGTDKATNSAKDKIDSVDNYTVTLIKSDLGRQRENIFQKQFLDDNSTYGIVHVDEEWIMTHPDETYVPGEYTYTDMESPPTRAHVIKNHEQLQSVFIEAPQVDFEKEIIVVVLLSQRVNRYIVTRKFIWDGDTIRIYHMIEDTGVVDRGTPQWQQLVLAYKMNITNVSTAESVIEKKI